MASYFEKKADEAIKNDEQQLPEWVSKQNASYDAYICIDALKEERMSFINNHQRKSNYKSKKVYQISGAEVARKINLANATLLCTSAYSSAVSQYLEQVNKDLQQKKEHRLQKTHQHKSRGPVARNKDELVAEVVALKKKVKEIEEQDVKEQVTEIFNQLNINVRVRLHINAGG